MSRRFFKEIPATREGFPGNVPPICQSDLRQFSQVHGEELTEMVRFFIQSCIRDGGFNPNTVDAIFPEGRDAKPDEDELIRSADNYFTWQEFDM